MEMFVLGGWNLNGLYVLAAIALLGSIFAIALRRDIGKLPGEVLLGVALTLGACGAIKNAFADRLHAPDIVLFVVTIAAGLFLFRTFIHALRSTKWPISN